MQIEARVTNHQTTAIVAITGSRKVLLGESRATGEREAKREVLRQRDAIESIRQIARKEG